MRHPVIAVKSPSHIIAERRFASVTISNWTGTAHPAGGGIQRNGVDGKLRDETVNQPDVRGKTDVINQLPVDLFAARCGKKWSLPRSVNHVGHSSLGGVIIMQDCRASKIPAVQIFQ
jgi:hypothetical protein